MAFIPVENVAQFDIRYALDSQQVENTIYCERLAGWDATALLDAATIIRVNLVDVITALMTPLIVWRSILCTDLTAFDGTQVEYFGTGEVPGTSTGSHMPNNVAWVVKFITETRGRSFRGRNYIPGLTGESIEDNLMSTESADTIVTAYQDTFDDLDAAAYIPVVVSRYHLNAPRVAGVATPISSVTYTDLVVDSQRRRLPGRGH